MIIGIIARGLTNGGVKRVVENILYEFEKIKKQEYYVFTDNEEYVKQFPNLKVILIKKTNRFYWDYIKSLKIIKQFKLDALIYPKHIIPFTHKKIRCKKYNIIHDLGYFHKELNAYPFWDTLYMKLVTGKSLKYADKIFSVSEYTKTDIIKNFNIDKNKIFVINEGIENKFRQINNIKLIQKTINKYSLKQPFMFFSGSLSPRKNIVKVLKAFSKIKNKIPHNLYLTGLKSWGNQKELKTLIISLGDRVKILGYVSDEELIHIYNVTDLYLYPSLFEGFGLPILEAQSCGCPVLTSNVSSCLEVVGKGALIVDPYSEKEIYNAMLKAIKDKKFRNKLIKLGFKNIKRYSWEKTANKIIKIIENE